MATFSVYVLPSALAEISASPGHVRQRIRRAVMALRGEGQPPGSRRLDFASESQCELWRLRLDTWRIVYLMDRGWGKIYVLAVRRRPPYQYDDLDTLAGTVE
jgi:mRNA interferase RelE/StbE